MISTIIAAEEPLFSEGLANVLKRDPGIKVINQSITQSDLIIKVGQLKPQVVISCLSILEPNPFNLIHQIKQMDAKLAIIILSNNSNATTILRCFKAGAHAYLLKSASTIEMINAVKSVYSGEAVLSFRCLSSIIEISDHLINDYNDSYFKATLGERAFDVLLMASRGMTNRQISEALSISSRTVQSHFRNIFNKLGVASRTEAVAVAWRSGLFTPDDYQY